MAIKTYKKGDNTNVATNFKAREFDCQGNGCCNHTIIDEKLVEYLQNIRTHFGKPVYLTAYRCQTHNARTPNAAPNSYHIYGQAADFHIDGVSPKEIAKYAESIGVKGIGLYDTFVHIDTRENKSFWYSHAQQKRTTFGGEVKKNLEESGLWDKATTNRLQEIFGTPIDGFVSNQNIKYMEQNPGLTSGWKWYTYPSKNGSQLIKAMQKWAGMPVWERDGKIGPKTIKAFQKKLGTFVDGVVSCPSQMVKALQRWANEQ